MRVTLKFPETESPTEILEFLTNLTKQYCLEAEWKKLEPLFTKFYNIERVKHRLQDMSNTYQECGLVIKILNDIYMNYHWGTEGLARDIAIRVADRCNCMSSYTF